MPATPAADSLRLVQALQKQWGAALIETHISWVLLDGEHAWKIKKPVRLPFLNASELDTRLQLCEAECRLNRRLAPSVYLGVVPLRGTPGAPRLTGEGAVIEYALKMRQFPPGALLSEHLAEGRLLPAHIDALAHRLARFHQEALVAPPGAPFGTPELIELQIRRVIEGLAPQDGGQAARRAWLAWLQTQTTALHATWLRRRAQGRIVEGHGDLHLANTVVLGDEVTAFDCIEFDPTLRWIDPISDIAFTAMDLMAQHRTDLAWRFLNTWLDDTGDHAGLPTLRVYLVYRALVRALVARLRDPHGQNPNRPDYIGLAQQFLAPPRPSLLITHGLSGSGKSFQSQRLLERDQAIRLRADVERKRLFGLPALAKSKGQVPDSIYTPEATQRTYARLLSLATLVLDAGYPVIVDAAFLKASERATFLRLAQWKGVPFTILHCEAPETTLRERVRARLAQGDDPSEADEAVLTSQIQKAEPLQPQERAWVVRV